MRNKPSIEFKQKKYLKLTKKLAQTGYVLQGTIHQRIITIKHPHRVKQFGPYYQWTFKREGKSITVNLTSKQAALFSKAIHNHRKIESILKQMRALSREILDSASPSVSKRNPKHSLVP